MSVATGASVTYSTDFTAGSYVVVDPQGQQPVFKEFKVT